MANLTLPTPPKPAGAYSACVVRNGIGFVSGQFPIFKGQLIHQGRVGSDLTLDKGRDACRQSALNVLAQIAAVTDEFRQLEGLLRIDGYVASAEGFFRQPEVLDAASETFVEYLGDKAGHARTALAVPWLPLNASVELAASFAVRTE